MRIVYLLIVLAVAIFAVIFALQNSMQIVISFFSWSTSGSLSLLLILAFAIGVVLGVLIMAPSAFKRSLQFSGLKRKFSRLEKEKTRLNKQIAESASETQKNDTANSPPIDQLKDSADPESN